MLRSLTIAVAASVGLVLGPLVWGPSMGSTAPPDHGGDLLQQIPAESRCVPSHIIDAQPRVLLFGETARIDMRATAICHGPLAPMHLVLVLDASASMAGERSTALQEAAIQLVADLDMAHFADVLVGVVEFDDQARKLTGLTNDEHQVLEAIRRLGASGGSAIDSGIRQGLQELLVGRHAAPNSGDASYELMLVVTDGSMAGAGCQPVIDAAEQVKNKGILAITTCLGPDCDTACMRQAASSPRYFYAAADAPDLDRVFREVTGQVLDLAVNWLSLWARLPDNIAYVPDSAEPEPWRMGADDSFVTWRFTTVPTEGVSVTFRAEPLESGNFPVLAQAGGVLTDTARAESAFDFPIPGIVVLAPGSPTPTDTPTPTSTDMPVEPHKFVTYLPAAQTGQD